MSINIKRTGIFSAGGTGIGENLILNSLPNSSTGWINSSYWNLTTKDGFKCIHMTGAMNSTKNTINIFSTTNAANFIPTSNQKIAFSADVLFENVVKGSTNYYITLYGSGTTINGTWYGSTMILYSNHFQSYNGWKGLDADLLNGKGWTHVWVVYQYSNVEYTSVVVPCLYARDFTGDVYFKNIKFEIGDKPTPWTPAPLDEIFVSNYSAFNENLINNNISLGQDYVQTKEFFEI